MKIYADHAATTAVSTSVLTRSPDRTCRPIVFSMCPSSFRDFWLPLYGKCDMVKIFNLFFFYKVSLGVPYADIFPGSPGRAAFV